MSNLIQLKFTVMYLFDLTFAIMFLLIPVTIIIQTEVNSIHNTRKAAMSLSKSRSSVPPIDTLAVDIENTLKHNEKWDDFLANLGRCCDDFERLKVVLGTSEVIDHISTGFVRWEKSMEQAEALRTKGNQYFKSAQYDKALNCYSQAVRFAPHPSQDNTSSTVLALCFGNRWVVVY